MDTWIVDEDRRVLTPHRYDSTHHWVRPVELLVLHYTVGYRRDAGDGRTPGAVRWFADERAKASAHFVVDGARVWQCAPLEDRCWHAGGSASRWRGKSVNVRSIGIEIANLGLLMTQRDGSLQDWWGRRFDGQGFKINASDYQRVAPARFETVRGLYASKGLPVPTVLVFEDYPAAQVRLVAALIEDLAERFPVIREDRDRLALHEETAPTRKLDPGPALWWRVNRWRDELAAGRRLSAPV